MKQFYFLIVALYFTTVCCSQTAGTSKIYGYKQEVLPGTVRVDDNGRAVKRPTRYNYFIYLASATPVTPIEIWIDGQAYAPVVNKVSGALVEYTNPTAGDNKPKLLVPKTPGKILQLSPSLDKIQTPTAKGKMLAAKNELVVIYKGKSKLFYKKLIKLTALDPVAMQ